MAIDLDVHGNTKPLEAAVQAAVNRIRRQPIKITVDDKGATQPLGNMKRGADEFTKSMEAANARILAFGASMAIINGVANAFKGMVKNLVEVEKAMADVNVVMGLSAQNLEKFSDGLFKVAKETGAAFRVAADAATEYARQGLGVEESLKRTRDALVLTRLTGMDSAEAVKSLTAAMNTYGTQIKDTTQLVSKFAAVDVKFAVSAQDFADAISRTGQSAQSAGVSIDELVGIVTAAQQKTARGGAVIGNALKTIFTKTGKTDTLNQLENLGIAVRDLEGNTIGAQRILNDLANTFDTLSAAQKAQITQTMGGLFHINILKAVLSDAAKQNGIMAEATRISAGATDEAIQKNEELRKTMSAVATETGLAIKQVSTQIGEIALAPGMEKILNSVKSLAEGLSGVLGDGESTGSSFATGLLKGIGNVITGPGLVVLAGVFFKLFGQALKFTKESLTSLVGVTTEKQKQKAIQTSLVALFGQNAALNKEMLRTDIGRTEKEKIILGLLKAQVVEANSLNKLTAGMAGTLYRKGYGANLTPVGKKASGHIPNFANPERAQAAQGGYAAGNIRSMNMPGEGPVIYNSAETVKNFAGFKQPAIMPPHSSKAGKNYQQAFGSIHGFDPYAAGGYIPNFAGPRTRINQSSAKYIGLSATNSADRAGTLYATAGKGISNVFSNVGEPYRKAAAKSKGAKIDYEFYSLDDSERRKYYNTNVEDELKEDLQRASHGIMNRLLKTLSSKDQNFIAKKADLSKDLPENKMSVAAGHIFEAAAKTILRSIGAEAAIPDSETARIDFLKNEELYELFGVKGPKGSVGAEAKINSDTNNAKSFARKIYDLEVGGKGITNTSKTSALLKTNADKKEFESWVATNAGKKFGDIEIKSQGAARSNQLKNRNQRSKLLTAFSNRNNAYGHIPNFADPLSDAIGREKAAGVPVSQIRVGSHGALMGKGNPLGLGVTNTHDEPNGLRDVFGANGFVPNYAAQDFNQEDFVGSSKSQRKKLAAILREKIKAGELAVKSEKEFSQLVSQINPDIKLHGRGIRKANQLIEVSNSTISSNNSIRKTLGTRLKSEYGSITGGFSSMNRKFGESRTGKMLGSTGGQMGIMMGLPMAAGFFQDTVGGQVGASVGGGLSGAGTGAAMGMIFGPLGIAVGAVAGGLYGLVNGLNEAEEAAKDKAAQDRKAATQAFAQTGAQFLTGRIDPNQTLAKAGIGGEFYQKYQEKLGGKTMVEAFEMFSTKSKDSRDKEAIYDRLSGQFGKVDARRIFGEKGIQRELLLKGLEGRGEEVFRGKEMLEKFGIKKETATGAELMEVVKTAKGSKIEELFNAIKIELQERLKSESEQAQGVILQLNAQRAILAAQQKAKEIQFDIKSSYAQIDSSLSLQAKLMGSFATEQQKAQMNYTKAVNKAAEKYATGAQSEEGQYRASMLAFSKDKVIAGALKTSLAKKQILRDQGPGGLMSDNVANTAEKIDLTKELLKLSNDELYAELEKAKLSSTQLQTLEDFKNSKEKNVEMLLKELGLSTKIAENEFKINDAIAKRKDLLANMSGAIGMSDKQLAHDQKMRGFASQLAAAQRLTAVGPGYQTRAEQEDFQMREKRITLGETATTLRENATSAVNKKIKERTDLELQQQIAQERVSAIKGGAQPTTAQEQQELEALLVKQQQTLAFIDHEIKNINESTEEEISNAKKLLAEEEKRLAAKRAHETGPGAFGRGMSDTAKSMREQVEYMDYELGKRIPTAFADGLAGAMTEAINGTKSIKEGLMDAAISFLGMIQQAMMQKMAYQMVGAMGFSKGGNVRKYSKGGGVPAMVSNGEYVMGRDAVNKYGGSFMHGMNAGGSIPGFASGGSVENDLLSKGKIRREGAPGGPAAQGSALAANFGGGRGFDSGRLYQRKAMSGAFYAQSGNVGLAEDTSAIQSILSEEERIRQEAEAKRQAKKAKRRQLLGMVLGTVASYGLGKIFSGGSGSGLFSPKPTGTGTVLKTPNAGWGSIAQGSDLVSDIAGGGGGFNPGAMDKIFNIDSRLGPWKPNYYGGSIRKYASGGHIAGKSGIDQIPAMLSEGEYVIRASSARQIGRPMLDRINAGKFNDGGAVSEIAGSSETGSSGGNTNNISISINMERGSSNQKQQKENESSGVNPADASSDEKNSSELAERIKQQVVSVIMEEQRPGGLLSD